MTELINHTKEILTGGVIFNALTIIVAITGVITTIIFYNKSKKSTKATYAIRTIRLINEGIEKLKLINILYDNKPVVNLSISKIAIWNNGTETIGYESVAKNNPLRIKTVGENKILGADILYEKDPSNDFNISVSSNQNEVEIKFDYFDKQDGIVVQIYHTGKSSDDIVINGQIKSCKQIQRTDIYVQPLPIPSLKLSKITNKNKYRKIFGWVILLFSVTIIIFGLYDVWFKIPQESKEINPFSQSIPIIFGALIYFIMGYRIIKRRIPKGFDIFNEEI